MHRYRLSRGASTIGDMHVSLLYFATCPNWPLAGQRLRVAPDAVGRSDTEIVFRVYATPTGLVGVPTVDDLTPALGRKADR